jgi:tape measure domain-containing protein
MAKGNGPIQYSELFSQDVNAKLSELQSLVNNIDADFQNLSTTIKGMSGRINVSIKGNAQVVRDLDTAVAHVDVTTRGAADSLEDYGKTLDATAKQTSNLKTQQQGLDQIFDVATASSNDLKLQIKALTAEYLAMGRATDADKTKLTSLASQVRALKNEQDNLSGALKTTRTSLQSAEGSYNAMSQKLNQLRKDLKEIPGAFNAQTGAINKGIPAVARYVSEINRLDATIKKVDATLGQHQRNVGNYSGALGGVGGQLAQLAAGYLTVQTAMQAAGRAFDSAMQLDSISTVLEFTFKSADIAEEKLRMLRESADRLGVGYISLANSYKSFTAAAIASNFPLVQAEKIFSAVTNAGAKMKLTSDQMSGALLALQQMISKGNVQAEELRGQLSERLPGAFAIAARAMGVTEMQLNKMLKDGQVLAADLLPKLATELDKTFGNDKTERIESLQASWTRLKNSFDFTVESSRVGQFFKLVIDGLEGAASRFSKIVNSSSWKEFFLRVAGIANIGTGSGAAFEAFAGGEAAANTPASTPFIQPTGSGATGDAAGAKTVKAKTALDLLKEKIDAITLSLKLQALQAIQTKKAYTPDPATIAKLKELEDQLGFADRGGRNAQIDTSKADTGARAANRVRITDRGVQWVDDVAKITGIQKAIMEAPMLEMDELLDKLAESDSKRQMDLTKVYSDEIQKRLQKVEDAKAAFSSAIDIMRQNANVLGELFGQEFGNLFSELTTTLEEFVLTGSVGFEQLAQVAISSVRAINESYQQGTELRIEALQLEKQAQVDIAGTNKDARLNIEKEYNDRIRAEKIKQARLDKQAAVFEIAINTAVAASKVVGQTGLLGIPLVPIVIALGLAQIAAVIARPIPQFRGGTQNSPEGLAEVAEDGAEAIQSPRGQMRIAHKRQLTYLERGSKVFTASQTKKMLEMGELDRVTDLHGRLAINMQNSKRDEAVKTMALAMYQSRVNPDEIGESVGQAVGRLTLTQWSVDENGFTKKIRKGNTTTEYLNNRYRL